MLSPSRSRLREFSVCVFTETFRGCLRRYFYQYSWKFEWELPLDRILLLRQLSSAAPAPAAPPSH